MDLRSVEGIELTTRTVAEKKWETGSAVVSPGGWCCWCWCHCHFSF